MSKRKKSDDSGKVSFSKKQDYITYGLEWDSTYTGIYNSPEKKSLIDRQVIFKNGKVQFTSEGLDEEMWVNCEENQEIGQKIVELKEIIPKSNTLSKKIYEKQLEDLLQKRKGCNCKYSLESQLGVFTYSVQNSDKYIEEFNNSYNSFIQIVQNMLETSEIQGYKLSSHQTTHGRGCDVNDWDLKFKGCSLEDRGVNYMGQSTCSYFQPINEWYKYNNQITISGRPQMTVGISLKYIPKVFLLYDLYSKKTSTYYENAIYILDRIDFDNITEDEYNCLLGFLILMLNYSYSFFKQHGDSYFKSLFPIKLRTNPASIYNSFSDRLKSAFPIILAKIKEIVEEEVLTLNKENPNNVTYFYQEIKKFIDEDPPYDNSSLSNEFLHKFLNFGAFDLLYKKLSIILQGKHKKMYLISKFKDVELPEGIQDGTLYDIPDFEKKKHEYSYYFDISPTNFREVPTINFQYNLYDTKTKRFLEDKQDSSFEPVLYLQAGFTSKTPKIPKLMFKGSRFGIWEWPDFGKNDGFVHIEFRNFTDIYRSSQIIDLYNTSSPIDKIYDMTDINSANYLSFRFPTIFIIEKFFGTVLEGENNENFFEKILLLTENKKISSTSILNDVFSFFQGNIILFTLPIEKLMRIKEILEILYNTEENRPKMDKLKIMVNQYTCKTLYRQPMKPCNFVKLFLRQESIPDNVQYIQSIVDTIYRMSLLFGDIFNSSINFAESDIISLFNETTNSISDQDLNRTREYLVSIGITSPEDILRFSLDNKDQFMNILHNRDIKNPSIFSKIPLLGRFFS